MEFLIVWIIQMRKIVMKKNVDEINVFIVDEKANVHEEKIRNGIFF
jgi:hypothetical protein